MRHLRDGKPLDGERPIKCSGCRTHGFMRIDGLNRKNRTQRAVDGLGQGAEVGFWPAHGIAAKQLHIPRENWLPDMV